VNSPSLKGPIPTPLREFRVSGGCRFKECFYLVGSEEAPSTRITILNTVPDSVIESPGWICDGPGKIQRLSRRRQQQDGMNEIS
jgi:hypothetical protein